MAKSTGLFFLLRTLVYVVLIHPCTDFTEQTASWEGKRRWETSECVCESTIRIYLG